MHEINDAQWLAFEVLAKTYPHDDGVRMIADLARWLVEERQRHQLPVSPTMQKVVRTVTQELQSSAAQPLSRSAAQPLSRSAAQPLSRLGGDPLTNE